MFITYRVRKENYTALKDTAFHLNNYITFKLISASDSSRFYDTFQKILLNHLFNFLPCFAGECFLVLHFYVLIGERVWVKDRAPWVSNTSACNFAVKNLAEYIEEREKLLNAADSIDG